MCHFTLRYGLFRDAIHAVSDFKTAYITKKRAVFVKTIYSTKLFVSYFSIFLNVKIKESEGEDRGANDCPVVRISVVAEVLTMARAHGCRTISAWIFYLCKKT